MRVQQTLFDLPPIQSPEAREEDLPASLRELLDAGVSCETVEALVEKLGGLVLYVPRDPEPTHPLSQAVGHAAAARLAQYAGGTRITIPRGAAMRRRVRDEAIRRDYTAGANMTDLVTRYQVTERWVREVLGRV